MSWGPKSVEPQFICTACRPYHTGTDSRAGSVCVSHMIFFIVTIFLIFTIFRLEPMIFRHFSFFYFFFSHPLLFYLFKFLLYFFSLLNPARCIGILEVLECP